MGYFIKNSIKNIALSLIIGSCILFYSFGYIIVYSGLHVQFKEEGIRKIRRYSAEKTIKGFNFVKSIDSLPLPNKNYLSVLKIHKSLYYGKSEKFMYVKKHEIKYLGNLYDIIKKKQIGDTIYILCISDKNEDILEKAFLEHFFADKANSSKNQPLKILLSKLQFDGLIENGIILPYIQNGRKNYPHVFSSLLKTVLDIPAPPPKYYI